MCSKIVPRIFIHNQPLLHTFCFTPFFTLTYLNWSKEHKASLALGLNVNAVPNNNTFGRRMFKMVLLPRKEEPRSLCALCALCALCGSVAGGTFGIPNVTDIIEQSQSKTLKNPSEWEKQKKRNTYENVPAFFCERRFLERPNHPRKNIRPSDHREWIPPPRTTNRAN